MSSSSSAIERLIRRAMGILETESPCHTQMFHEALGSLAIVLEIEGETLRLSTTDGELAISHDTHGHVRVRATLRLVPALVGGQLSVLEAVRTGQLEARGNAGALDHAARATDVFLNGIVRCRSGGELVKELHGLVEAT